MRSQAYSIKFEIIMDIGIHVKPHINRKQMKKSKSTILGCRFEGPTTARYSHAIGATININTILL